MTEHGYSAYSHGCRCDVCRAAKAKYQRERRAAAKANRRGYIAYGIKHGLAGYQEFACRCYTCRWWKAEYERGRKRPMVPVSKSKDAIAALRRKVGIPPSGPTNALRRRWLRDEQASTSCSTCGSELTVDGAS